MDYHDTIDDGQEYCYWCSHYHSGPVSSGGAPAEGCADYEPVEEEDNAL